MGAPGARRGARGAPRAPVRPSRLVVVVGTSTSAVGSPYWAGGRLGGFKSAKVCLLLCAVCGQCCMLYLIYLQLPLATRQLLVARCSLLEAGPSALLVLFLVIVISSTGFGLSFS
jgi:hypothetical protein